MYALKLAIFLLPLWAFPLQTHQTNRITVQRYSNCSELSDVECCEQMLKLSAFKSTRDQLPDLAIQAVKMSCQEKQRKATQANCRGIAFARRFPAKEVNRICAEAGIKKRCAKDPVCRKCTQQLSRLKYQASYWTCSAVTWKSKGKSKEPKVISIGSDRESEGSSTGQVIKYRERLQ